MILIAPKGHFFTQIPQPIHSLSDMNAILEDSVTSIHSFPDLTTIARISFLQLIKHTNLGKG